MVRPDEPQARLHIDGIKSDDCYGLMGGADFGVAIMEQTRRVCDDLAAALRREGFTRATLVLSADETVGVSAAHRSMNEPPMFPPTDEDCPF